MKRIILAALAAVSLSVGASSMAFADFGQHISAPVAQDNGQG